MKTELKTLPLLISLLWVPAQIMAQDTANSQQDAIQKLQTKIEEMQAQMSAMKAELDALHGTADLSHAVMDMQAVPQSLETGSIERTMPPLPPAVKVTPEQQETAVGKETADYVTYSEESEPVPRLWNVPLESTMPGFFVLPGTQTMLRINGNFKTDLMYDPRPAGFQDAFIPSTIPVPQTSSTNNFNASVRESRFSTDFRIPVSGVGTARLFMQMDFFGGIGATTPRLRHLYAQVGNILVGQTNSNFMDPDAWPDIVDFWGPSSGLLARPPQLRYSFMLGKGWSGAASVEQPDSDIRFTVDGAPAIPVTPAPDAALHVRYETQRGHIMLATVFRNLAAKLPTNGQQENAFGWGLSFTSTWRTFGRDALNYQVAYGNGIARYGGDTGALGLDAAPRSQTDLTLKALPMFAPWVSYQHWWSRNIRSSATFGLAQIQNTEFQPGNTYHKSTYSSVNVIWNVIGSLDFGAEFLYGWVEEKDGSHANAPRFQLSGRYTFVKLHPDE